jgi:protease-4
VVKSGPYKDIGSPTRPMTDSDKAILQSMIDDVQSQFVEAVAVGRNLDESAVRNLADGRIFTGRQAQQFGLVDELGSLEAAIRYSGELAGIDGDPDVVYPPGPKPRLIDFIIEESIARIQSALQKPRFVGMQYLWEGFN